MSHRTNNTLIAHNICKSIGEKEVLRGVNLSVTSGDLLVIRGSSGSGKTTLLSILGLIASPTSGKLSIDGSPLEGNPKQLSKIRRENYSYVFQRGGLVEFLSVEENTELCLKYRRKSKQLVRSRATSALESVGLIDKRGSSVKNLSGGERIRVSIARALAVSSPFILCDEPTAALDDVNSHATAQALTVATKGGCAVIACTHDPILLTYATKVLEL